MFNFFKTLVYVCAFRPLFAGTAAARVSERIARNWAGNLEYNGADTLYPKTAIELADIVRHGVVNTETSSSAEGVIQQLSPLHVVGSRHSFSAVADTIAGGNLISMSRMNRIVSLDERNMRVTVDPGITFAELGNALRKSGLALSNYASLPHITLAGAIATSSHGSGIENGILASMVLEYDIIDDVGRTHTYSLINDDISDDEDFSTGMVSMGAVGIISRIVIQAVPQFKIMQCSFPLVPLNALFDDVEGFFALGYSVSAFTDWKSHDVFTSVRIKSLPSDQMAAAAAHPGSICGDFFGQKAKLLHPVPGMNPKDSTPMGILDSDIGLPHFPASTSPSAGGNELQSEYFVDMDQAESSFQALLQVADQLVNYILVSELRVVKSDAFPLSVCYNRDQPCVGFHFTWINDVESVTKKMLPLVEKTLEPWRPRPHHGKLHTIKVEEWRRRYPGWQKVALLARKNDASGRFTNDFLSKYVGTHGTPRRGRGDIHFQELDDEKYCIQGDSCTGKGGSKNKDIRLHVFSQYVELVQSFVANHRLAVAFSVVVLSAVAPFIMLKLVLEVGA